MKFFRLIGLALEYILILSWVTANGYSPRDNSVANVYVPAGEAPEVLGQSSGQGGVGKISS